MTQAITARVYTYFVAPRILHVMISRKIVKDPSFSGNFALFHTHLQTLPRCTREIHNFVLIVRGMAKHPRDLIMHRRHED